MDQFNKRLNKIIQNSKDVIDRMASVEHDNDKLKQVNDGLYSEITAKKIRINQLEQSTKKNYIMISGVKETFAERTDGGAFADNR